MPPFVTGYQGYFNPSRSVIIAAGAQESEVIDCGGMSLVGVILPNVFTGTALSFMVGDSADGYQATGQVVFTTNVANNDTITLNGVVITFKSSSPSGNQVLIGADAAASAAALQAFLDATTDTDLLALTYVTSGTTLMVTAKVYGTAGNSIVFDKSSSHLTLTPSGGVLSGGGFRPLYDSSNAIISYTVAQGRSYAIDPKNFQGVPFMKVKSGSAEAAARTVVCALKGI